MNLNPEFNRRSFMAAILGACAAPAIVRASSIMPIYVPTRQIVLPVREIEIYGPEWMEAMSGTRMSGGSMGDIHSGRCVRHTGKDGVTFMGYRFPEGHETLWQ